MVSSTAPENSSFLGWSFRRITRARRSVTMKRTFTSICWSMTPLFSSSFQMDPFLQLLIHAWPPCAFVPSMSTSVSMMSRFRASGLSLVIIIFFPFLSTDWYSRLYLLDTVVQSLIIFKNGDLGFTIFVSYVISLKTVFMDLPTFMEEFLRKFYRWLLRMSAVTSLMAIFRSQLNNVVMRSLLTQ